MSFSASLLAPVVVLAALSNVLGDEESAIGDPFEPVALPTNIITQVAASPIAIGYVLS